MGGINMNTVISMLLAIINGSFAHDIYYDIAVNVLRYCYNPDQLFLSELTKECYTTTAVINKFCKSLGFSNFSEFKFNFVNGYHVRNEQMRFRLSNMDTKEILDHIQYLAKIPFDRKEFISIVDQVVEYIYESQQILILGAVFPTALTINFQEDMIIMGKFTYGCPQNNVMQLKNISHDTLVFVVSLTGRLYEYMKSDFHNLCIKQDNIILVSGYHQYPYYDSIRKIINIPILEDNEVGNVLILEIFRYIKYIYYKKYIKR